MRLLVTGGSGFIGTNYMDYALSKGIEALINIDLKPPFKKEHNKYWHQCDIMDYKKLRKIILDFLPTHVVHLAAKTGAHSITDINEFQPNIKGVRNLIDVLKEVESVERVIFTSTLLVCKMGYIPKHDTDYAPTTAYGMSKVEGEKIVRNANDINFVWTIIRPISVWGPWMIEPYISFFKAIKGGWYFHIGDGHYRRSMGYVENIAHQIHCILLAPEDKVNKKTFYVGDPEPIDLYEFAEKIRAKLNAPKIRHIPIWLITIAAKAGDILKFLGWKNVPMSSFRLNNIRTEYIFDLSPIMSISSPLPYDMDTAIERTVEWFKSHHLKLKS
jgi:nucleoside-diphosphate-sugar epimerase